MNGTFAWLVTNFILQNQPTHWHVHAFYKICVAVFYLTFHVTLESDTFKKMLLFSVTILMEDKLNLTTQFSGVFDTATCKDFVGLTQPWRHYKISSLSFYQYSFIKNYYRTNQFKFYFPF